MTAISRKVKSFSSGNKFVADTQTIIGCILCLVTGLGAGVSRWCDLPMASTAFLLAYCLNTKAYRYMILLGLALSTGIASIDSRANLAYFLAAIIFVAVDNYIHSEKAAMVSACGIMGVVKLFLVSFNLPFYYKIMAVAEPVLCYTASICAQTGISFFYNNDQSRSFSDVVSSLPAAMAFTLALCGLDSHFLYFSMAVATGTGLFYISNGCITAACVCFLAGLLAVFDKIGFTYLFISFMAVIVIAGFSAEKISLWIYPTTVFAGIIANIIFIAEFNSFALTGTVLGALVVYTFLPYIQFFKLKPQSAILTTGRDWRLLMLSLKKLENCLTFLAGSVIDISRLNEKYNVSQSLEDLVAEDVCRRCDKNTYCWQEKYSFTQQQFAQYGEKMHWIGENCFSTAFCTQCINVQGVINSFEENSKLLLSRKYIMQAQKNNQKLLQNAFLSISDAVGDLIYQNQRSQLINATITMEMHRFLSEMMLGHSCCLCSQNPDKASFAVSEPLEEKLLYRIANKLENLYNVKFASPYVEQQGTEYIYIFDARSIYSYDVAVETSRLKRINGDNYDIFVHNGCVYAILSDGMGTGRQAAAESRTAVAMAKSLIVSGVSIKIVIDIVNLALNLKGCGETSASMDIMQINLSDGNSRITKAGAGISTMINKQGITRYYQDSLPLGILKDVKPASFDFRLSAGDTIILMSDGAGVVSASLKDMYSESCQTIAGAIIEGNKVQDDKTAIVLRLKIDI